MALSDRLCRSAELGIGYVDLTAPSLTWQPDWKILTEKTPYASHMRWQDFIKAAANYLHEVKELVKAVCHNPLRLKLSLQKKLRPLGRG